MMIELKWPKFGRHLESNSWKNANAFDEYAVDYPRMVHIERMSEDAVYVGVGDPKGGERGDLARFMLMVRNGKIEVEVY